MVLKIGVFEIGVSLSHPLVLVSRQCSRGKLSVFVTQNLISLFGNPDNFGQKDFVNWKINSFVTLSDSTP